MTTNETSLASHGAKFQVEMQQLAVATLSRHPATEILPTVKSDQLGAFVEGGYSCLAGSVVVDQENRVIIGMADVEAAARRGEEFIQCRVIDCTDQEAVRIALEHLLAQPNLSEDQRIAATVELYENYAAEGKQRRARAGGKGRSAARQVAEERVAEETTNAETAEEYIPARARGAAVAGVSDSKFRTGLAIYKACKETHKEVLLGTMTRRHALAHLRGIGKLGPVPERAKKTSEPARLRSLYQELSSPKAVEVFAREVIGSYGSEAAQQLVATLTAILETQEASVA